MTKICKHCFVSGRVQAVFYRKTTQTQARKLNVTGWAKNLADGRVEVMACGTAADVEKLVAWLAEGPTLAKVTNVAVTAVEYTEYENFDTL